MLLIRNFTFMLFLNCTSTSLTAYSGTSSTVSITVPLPHIKTVYSICGMAYSPLSEFLNSYFSFSYTGRFYSWYLHHIQLPQFTYPTKAAALGCFLPWTLTGPGSIIFLGVAYPLTSGQLTKWLGLKESIHYQHIN